MKYLLIALNLCAVLAHGQVNTKLYLIGAESSEECQEIDQHLRNKTGVLVSRTDAHRKLIFLRHEEGIKVDQITVQSWLSELSNEYQIVRQDQINSSNKAQESNSIVTVKGFPEYIDTGNKEADEQAYIAKRLTWQSNNATTYEQLLGHRGQTIRE